MTIPQPDPVSFGLASAQTRLDRYNIDFSLDKIDTTMRETFDYLGRTETPARAGEFAIETVAIAATMRSFYDEPALTQMELTIFLDKLREFMNSWWHD